MGHKTQEIVTAGTALNRRNMVGAVHKMRKGGFILEFAEQVNTKESERSSRYGGWLADEIRAKTQDFSKLDEFE